MPTPDRTGPSAPGSAPYVLLGLCLAAACGSPEPPLPEGAVRNAILVTLDTTRLNSLGIYDCPADSSPHLDAFAAESVVYERCRTVAPITLPAHASMLTGLYPPRHGLRDNGLAPLPSGAATLAERASAAGIDTAAFVAALVLDRQYGLDQGFELYDQPQRPVQQDSSRFAERGARETLTAARAWLDRRAAAASAGAEPSGRYFLWVHLFDPHAPYEAPERFLQQVANREGVGHPYIAEVAKTDHELGAFLAALRADGHLDETAVLIVADHGEGLFGHGEPNHAAYLYDTTVRVPLLLRYPDGYRAGERSDEITSVVDVAPTLCDALGLAPLGDVDGLSLWRRRVPEARGVYFESYHGYYTYGWAPLSGWADAEAKYIHSGAPELYEPDVDRTEGNNVYAERPERAERYRAGIASVAAAPALEPEAFEGSSAERLRAIAALGYATGAPGGDEDLPGPLEPSDRPIPAHMGQELLVFLEAQSLVDQRKLPDAGRLLEQIVQRNPGHLAALEKLGLVHVMLGSWPRAIAVFERRLSLASAPTATHVNLALAYENVGRLEDAARHLVLALEQDPEEPTARINIARVLNGLGRADEARAYLETGRAP